MRRQLFAAAALAVLIGAGWLALRNVETQPALRSTSPAAAIQTPALDDNVVLWWLDPQTPVYFVLTPPNHKE